MFDLYLKNAIIISPNFSKPIFKTSIGIKKGKIVFIGKKDSPAKKVYDLKAKVVIPGLINCHTHAAMSAYRGLADDLPLNEWLEKHIWPREQKDLSPAFVKKWVSLSCDEMVAGGTTSFCDMYFNAKDAIRGATKKGLRITTGEAILDFKKDSYRNAKELFYLKQNSLSNIAVMAHAVYSVLPKNLIAAKRLADKYQTKLFLHVAETKKDKEDVKTLNKLGLLDKNTVLIHAVWLDENDINIIAKTGARVVHCPQSNMKLASGIAPIAQMVDAGINAGLGTDGAASNNTLDMFAEMKTAALLQKVANLNPTILPAKKVFEMATINGAKILGLENEIGSIEIGKQADLAILDFNQPHLKPVYDYYSHLVYSAKSSDVIMTIVNGKLVYQNKLY